MTDYNIVIFRPPDGIELRPVTRYSDIQKADSVYPRHSSNSLAYIERMANYNINIGAYNKEGTLVAWIFRTATGFLSALQTDKDHLGHGYAALVTKYVSKKIAEMDQNIYAGIFEANHPSRKLFEKLGFTITGRVHWITNKVNSIRE